MVSWALFGIALSAVTVAGVFAITLAGLPLLVAAAGVVRGCANAERARLRQVFSEPVRGGYRAVSRPGIMSQVSVRWRDLATWRDLAYLLGLWLPLYVLDTIVLTIWLTFLGGITLPIWYRFARNDFTNGESAHGVGLGYFPNGPHGPGAAGLFVANLPTALLAAAGFLVLFLVFNYVLVATALAHARIARALLRPPADPLAQAKSVLAHRGPLPPLVRSGGDAPRHQA